MQTCDQIHSYKTSLLLLVKLTLVDRGGRVIKGSWGALQILQQSLWSRGNQWGSPWKTFQSSPLVSVCMCRLCSHAMPRHATSEPPHMKKGYFNVQFQVSLQFSIISIILYILNRFYCVCAWRSECKTHYKSVQQCGLFRDGLQPKMRATVQSAPYIFSFFFFCNFSSRR